MKKVVVAIAFCLNFIRVDAQQTEPVKNWQNLDLKADGFFGISINKAYQELLKGKKPIAVTVAVLDGGIDVNHEDLKGVIWTNPKEIPGNGKDDDGNGFVDDVHGWNFQSSMMKGDEEFDLMALAKKARKNSAARKELDSALLADEKKLKELKTDEAALQQVLQKIGKDHPTGNDFRNYIPTSEEQLKMQTSVVQGLKVNQDYIPLMKFQMDRDINVLETGLAYKKSGDYDLITGGPSAHHGTHIAGIIAAVRDNKIGIDGVADDVKLMSVRTTAGYTPVQKNPEMKMAIMTNQVENEDLQVVAKAIRYAVDNGARIINMSFGNTIKWRSDQLDEAVKYAAQKNVLIVHSAGNLGVDLDQRNDYPNRHNAQGQALAANWISVGSSGWKDDEKLVGAFSNYGQLSVDVFAPGMSITSTTPRSTYWTDSGTSMATPVVVGLAAVIMEYYPKLTAVQVKDIILKSVVKRDLLKDKCLSGGVVNAYQALTLAATY